MRLSAFLAKQVAVLIRKKKSFHWGVFFLLIILICAVLGASLYFQYKEKFPEIHGWIAQQIDYLSKDLPDISIENGKLSSPDARYSKSWHDQFVFVITKEDIRQDSEFTQFPNALAITSDSVIYKHSKPGGEVAFRQYPLEQLQLKKMSASKGALRIELEGNVFEVTRESLNTYIQDFVNASIPFVFFVMVIYFTVVKLLQIILFSSFSLLVNALCRKGLSYGKLFVLGIYAMIIPVCVSLSITALQLTVPFLWGIYTILYLFFLFILIRNSEEV